MPWISNYKEIQPVHPNGDLSPEYSLEGLMLKLKLQYFGHLMRRTYSFEKTLMLGKIKVGGEDDVRGWDDWMASLTQWIWVWVDSGSWWWTGRPGVLQSMGSQRAGHNWVTELSWNIWNKNNTNLTGLLWKSNELDELKSTDPDVWLIFKWH